MNPSGKVSGHDDGDKIFDFRLIFALLWSKKSPLQIQSYDDLNEVAKIQWYIKCFQDQWYLQNGTSLPQLKLTQNNSN